jgi:hypothetical protein
VGGAHPTLASEPQNIEQGMTKFEVNSGVLQPSRLLARYSIFIPTAGITIVDGEFVAGICYNSRLTKAPSGRICHFQTAADSAGEDRQQAVA